MTKFYGSINFHHGKHFLFVILWIFVCGGNRSSNPACTKHLDETQWSETRDETYWAEIKTYCSETETRPEMHRPETRPRR